MKEPLLHISQEDFRVTLQSVHDAIFSGQEYSSEVFEEKFSPFVDKSWEKLLIAQGILRLKDEDFEALAHAASKVGDTRVIVTSAEIGHEVTVKVDWDREALEKARWNGTRFDLFETHAFGMSGAWGLMCYYDEFSMLGGTSAFMNMFLDAAGGRQRVKTRFIQHALEIWDMDPVQQVQILKSVGWSFSDASA